MEKTKYEEALERIKDSPLTKFQDFSEPEIRVVTISNRDKYFEEHSEKVDSLLA